MVEARTAAAQLWLLLVPGVLLPAAFVRWEIGHARRGHDPMVDLGLLRIRSSELGSTLGLLHCNGFTAIFFVFALFLQEGHGSSSLLSGPAVTPFAVDAAPVAP